MSLMAAVENLIKREKSSPTRVKPETKSSNEILSELFGVFNAAPPEIRETPERKSKKSKKEKKHKKDKKRSRYNSTSSDDSRRKRHKKKIKRQRSSSLSLTPSPKWKHSPERLPKSEKEQSKSKEKIKSEPKVKSEPKIKEEGVSKCKFRRISRESEKNLEISIKYEETRNIPMPDSPHLTSNDLRHTLESKAAENADPDKTKGKIQIKNLKFSTVFEETVRKAEEEARKKAEQCEEGEYTDTSSGSPDRPDSATENPEFPKSSDPGGILQKKSKEDKKSSEENLSQDKSRSDKDKKKNPERSSRRKSSERSRERSRRRSKSRSRHRSRSKDRNHKSRSKDRSHRSRSKDRSHRSRSKERSHRSRSKERRRSRSRDKKKSSRRSRSRSHPRALLRLGRHNNLKLGPRRSKSPAVRLADTEKRRLLEVARKNAINMLKNGAVPAAAAALPPHTRNQVMAAIQSGGKSVDELTDFCKHLSKKEALGELSSVSEGSDGSENEDTLAFHHPFLVRDKAPIVMNIRGGAPLPVKSSVPALVANKEELRMQFPVSSGTQHRGAGADKREWRAVTPPSGNQQVARLNHKYPSRGALSKDTLAVDKMEKALVPMNAPVSINAPLVAPPASDAAKTFAGGASLAPLPALPAPGPQVYPPGVEAPSNSVDIGDIVSQKLQAIRQQSERNDYAIDSSSRASFSQSAGALEPTRRLGAFTGAAGVNFLTPRELATGTQAWAKKDQLVRAAPVAGGMGMHLLQKMGWTPGRGLGKEESGTLQPLLLEVKLDTRGLQAKEEAQRKGGGRPRRMTASNISAAVSGVSGKHPVSLLGEYCSKRKMGPPEYELCMECGPDHKKNFLFKVKVGGVAYQPAVASINKKQAKADSAMLALQKLGVLP